MKNFIKKEQFPYTSALGWEYDSGDYHTAMGQALIRRLTIRVCGPSSRPTAQAFASRRNPLTDGHRRRVLHRDRRRRDRSRIATFSASACSIAARSAFIRPASAIARLGTISQGQGHATTFAQILASEIGIPADPSITVEEGDTDTAPYGLGTYGSRSTPVAGAATAMAGRKIRAKAQMIAAYLLEVHDDDLEWDVDRFQVKGAIRNAVEDHEAEIAFAAYNQAIPPGIEPGLEAVSYYDPPNMTYPFGAYICVVDIDVDTGVTDMQAVLCARRLRHAHQPDDHRRADPWRPHGSPRHRHGAGDRPMTGSATCKGASFMDYYPADCGRNAVLGNRSYRDAQSPHHPIGAKGRGRKPECRRRFGLFERGQRCLRPSRPVPHPNAPRPLAGVENRRESRPAWLIFRTRAKQGRQARLPTHRTGSTAWAQCPQSANCIGRV